MGPKRSYVEVTDTAIDVRLGVGFAATIPRSDVRSVVPWSGTVTGWGAHGWRGRWLVNGSSQGIVTITIDPPAKGRVLGIGVSLRELSISLIGPDAFITLVSPSAPTNQPTT